MKGATLFILLFLVSAGGYFRKEIRSSILKFSHHGLINFDYGILTDYDLALSDRGSYHATRFDGTNFGYPYWQCFNKKYFHAECSYNEPLDQQGSSFGIDIKTPNEIHNYSLNHAISGEVCDDMLARINEILKDRSHFCISGSNDNSEFVGKKREYSWSFHRMKTRSGYLHYFLEN